MPDQSVYGVKYRRTNKHRIILKRYRQKTDKLSNHNSSCTNLEEAVGGKWTMSAVCLSDRRAGTYTSLQMHMTGRFNTPPPPPCFFFLPCAALPLSFPSTNFMRTSMDACKQKIKSAHW
jgi:hypothetical protein